MKTKEDLYKFLEKNGIFYLTSIKDGKPRCRPFNFKMFLDNEIYFGTGTFKDVYKELNENPYTEIVSNDDEKFIRYHGNVKFDNDENLVNKALNIFPFMKNTYNEKTGLKLTIFHLENGICEVKNKTSLKTDEVIKF